MVHENSLKNLLKPGDPKHHTLTAEDRAKAVKNAAKKHHELKTLRDAVNFIAGLEIKGEKNKAILKDAGIPDDLLTNEFAIAHNIVQGALKNDHKSIAEYMDATGQRITRNINENHNLEYKPLIDLTNRKAVLEKKKNAGKKA